MSTKRLLVGVIVVQWLCISHLLLGQIQEGPISGVNEHHGPTMMVAAPKASLVSKDGLTGTQQFEQAKVVAANGPPFEGIAATLMLDNPKWFQRRYADLQKLFSALLRHHLSQQYTRCSTYIDIQ